MSDKVIVEGAARGPDSKNLQVQLREAFSKLLIEGRTRRRPAFVAGGSRGKAFNLFKTAHSYAPTGAYVALLVDSEEPVAEIERTWSHLRQRDGWKKPSGASDEQVLLMTTCMETWIVSDRQALRKHLPSFVRCEKILKDKLT